MMTVSADVHVVRLPDRLPYPATLLLADHLLCRLTPSTAWLARVGWLRRGFLHSDSSLRRPQVIIPACDERRGRCGADEFLTPANESAIALATQRAFEETVSVCSWSSGPYSGVLRQLAPVRSCRQSAPRASR
jgi:hypothetical protein